MSLSESALNKLSKDEVLALALERQNKFDSTYQQILISTKKYLIGQKTVKSFSQSFAFPVKPVQS